MSKFQYAFNPDKFSGHARILRLIKELNRASLRILDVGTGPGYIGRELKSSKGQRITMYGIESDPDSATAARPYYEKIEVGDLDVWTPEFFVSFDVIIFGAVLEHLKRPDFVLRRICRYLERDGTVIVSVPNVAHWWIRLCLLFGRFDYQDRGILDRTHLRFFTWNRFRQLLTDNGFRLVHHESSPTPLPILFPSTAQGKPFYFLHVINNWISKVRPPFFAFEFIVVAQLIVSVLPLDF